MDVISRLLAFDQERVMVLVLALARVGGLFIMGPIFAARMTPMMVRAGFVTGRGALRVVEECGGADDGQVGALGLGDPLGHAVDAQDMFEIVDGIRIRVPGAGLFNGGHETPEAEGRL
mgnify:CR=1 FL=1